MSTIEAPSAGDPLLAIEAEAAERERRSVVLRVVAPIVGVVGFLVVWQVAVEVFDIEQFVLPAPLDILDHIASDLAFYASNAWVTIREAFLGFMIAAVAALLLGSLMAHSRFIEDAVLPLAVLLQVTPVIAYAPAVVIWLGFGLKPILLITATVCFVPFLINTVTGLRSVDPQLLELARSVDAGSAEVFVRLRLPSSLPYLFSAARIAVGLALIGAVLGEFFAGTTAGLGYAVKTAQARNLVLQLWGSIYVLAFIGAVATLVLVALERLVLHWHSTQRT